jgi:adenylosuccinate synthase
MSVVAVIGAQWGDESKGKIVDGLAAPTSGRSADVVVRFQGGSNAGHTVVNDKGKFALHLLPVGTLYPRIISVIANGVVVDPEIVLQEIDELEGRGISVTNLHVSDRAHVVLPYHKIQDQLQEQSRGEWKLGTTLRGIGPAYEDKVARDGLRVSDLMDDGTLHDRLRYMVGQKNRLFAAVFGAAPISFQEVYDRARGYAQRLRPYVADTVDLLHRCLDEGKNIVLEGAQATLLDVEFGTYPMVTSSSPSIGSACTGTGLPPRAIEKVVGVYKAYYSRVGSGPFPTELDEETGDLIRQRGNEYGTTTGRPRRVGWFDAVLGRYAARVNGFDGFVINALDVLDVFDTIKLCVAYRHNGETINRVPTDARLLAQCEPVYEELPGWKSDTTGARRWEELPTNARRYVERLGELLGCPPSVVTVGLHRDCTIVRTPIL